MSYPFDCITEYLVKEYDIDLSNSYEICDVPARELIKFNRFDLMAKWIYIDAKEKKISIEYAYEIYYDNINAFSCGMFFEPGSEQKSSFQKYIEDFDNLIAEIKSNGFDKSKSLIPTGSDEDVMDGSHRVSVAAYYDKMVSIIKFPELKRKCCYDYLFFRKYMMSDVSMGYMAIQYAYLKKNCFLACLWQKVDLRKSKEVEEKLRTIGNIVYSQDIFLSYNGMCNFMAQIYGHQAWTGSIDDHFIGVRGKVDECYREGQPVRTYLFEAENLESVIDIKRRIRDIFQIGNHSIHISDNWDETIEMAEMLYNRNSVDFLNRANPYKYSNVYKKVNTLKKVLSDNEYDQRRFIWSPDAVLEVCGIQPISELKFWTDYNFEVEYQIAGVSNAFDGLQYSDNSLKDLLYNPSHYFYFNGMKFVTPKIALEMIKRRGEEKDIKSIKLLNKFINKRINIPKEYQFETIDKIRQYQLDNHVYGQGPWTYEQYQRHIRKAKASKIQNMIKLPLSFTYHYLIDRDFRSARKRERYIMRQRKRLENKDVSIISSNCNGGVISSDLGLQFKSPFVNLFIKASDYIKILSDLKGYMEEDLHFVNEIDSIYGEVSYPTAYLRDVKIYFMHYASEEEARNAWNRRKKRINWGNLYVIFTDRSGCTMDDLRAFDKLPYEHKVVFTHIPQPEIKSSFYIRGYEHENKVGILSDWQNASYPVKRVYDQFDYVKWFNEK
ncbi:MAG: DUF1919 domain-containing protein [Lachnospiraceae bacterium]